MNKKMKRIMKEEQIGCGVSLREAMPLGKETPLEVIKQLGIDGLSGGLSDVCLYASYKCNLNCYMCLVKHMKGQKIPSMTIDQIKEGLEDTKVLFHLGGEPWVKGNMMEIVEYFDAQGVSQIMSTNGTRITEEIVSNLKKLKHFVNIQVSLNAADELDGEIRGWSKSFERTFESIKMLVNAGLSTWIHCTIVNENIDELANVVKLGAELGVGAVNFIFAHVTTEEEIKTWWHQWPDAQIGVVTGKISNLVVIDIDTGTDPDSGPTWTPGYHLYRSREVR